MKDGTKNWVNDVWKEEQGKMKDGTKNRVNDLQNEELGTMKDGTKNEVNGVWKKIRVKRSFFFTNIQYIQGSKIIQDRALLKEVALLTVRLRRVCSVIYEDVCERLRLTRHLNRLSLLES